MKRVTCGIDLLNKEPYRVLYAKNSKIYLGLAATERIAITSVTVNYYELTALQIRITIYEEKMRVLFLRVSPERIN